MNKKILIQVLDFRIDERNKKLSLFLGLDSCTVSSI